MPSFTSAVLADVSYSHRLLQDSGSNSTADKQWTDEMAQALCQSLEQKLAARCTCVVDGEGDLDIDCKNYSGEDMELVMDPNGFVISSQDCQGLRGNYGQSLGQFCITRTYDPAYRTQQVPYKTCQATMKNLDCSTCQQTDNLCRDPTRYGGLVPGVLLHCGAAGHLYQTGSICPIGSSGREEVKFEARSSGGGGNGGSAAGSAVGAIFLVMYIMARVACRAAIRDSIRSQRTNNASAYATRVPTVELQDMPPGPPSAAQEHIPMAKAEPIV